MTCKTVTVLSHGKKLKRQKCTTKTITGTASFTTAHATLKRGTVTYATGTASTTRVTLRALRAVRPGRYTLVLTRTVGHRRLTTRRPIRIT